MSGQDQEVQELRAAVSCATVLEKQAWKLDKAQSTRHCWKYRRGAGEVVIVNHEGRGWWDPRGDSKGDVFALVQFLNPGLNFGQARQSLRELSGITPSFPVAIPALPEKGVSRPLTEQWDARRSLSEGSPTWRYLTETRALEVPVLLAAARVDAVCEGPYGSAWFAHRDMAGAVVGFEMRGPQFRGFAKDGDKILFQLRGSAEACAPTRLAVFEAPIDAMSLAGIERLRADTLYVATSGGMGPFTIAALEALLQAFALHPEAVLVAATDADEAGDRYAQKLMALAAVAKVRSGRILPFHGHKDWNEVAIVRRQAVLALQAATAPSPRTPDQERRA